MPYLSRVRHVMRAHLRQSVRQPGGTNKQTRGRLPYPLARSLYDSTGLTIASANP